MIGVPTSPEVARWCREFMLAENITLTPTAHFLFLVHGGLPSWVVAFDGWVGATCQLHVVSNGRTPIPRKLRKAVMAYGFHHLELKCMYAVVNSGNRRSMQLCEWVGFREVFRDRGLHDGGGDIVLLKLSSDAQLKRRVRHGKEYAENA